jgi:hypothetical protein
MATRRPSRWVSASAANPCLICHRGTGRCCRSTGDPIAICYHTSCSGRYGRGHEKRRRDRRYWVFRLPADAPPVTVAPAERPDISHVAHTFQAYFNADLADELIAQLRLPRWTADLLSAFGVGWRPEAVVRKNRRRRRWLQEGWTFPEKDGRERAIGLHVRFRDGTKRQHDGTARGVVIPDGWRGLADRLGVVFAVEGASDVIALTAAGLPALGRPSCDGGVDHLAQLLADLPDHVRIVVVAERDLKPNGRWPGRAGACRTASRLAARLGRKVLWALVPDRDKDGRDWLIRKAKGSQSRRRWERLGAEFRRRVLADATPAAPMGPPEPMPRTEHRCPKPFVGRFKGKPETSAAGLRAVGDCKCGRWDCPLIPDPERPGSRGVRPCRVWRSNRLAAWLWRCYLQFCDPVHIPEDSGDMPMPRGPDTTKAGPWDLYAVVATAPQIKSIRSSLSRQCGRHKRRIMEWVRIRIPDVSPAAGPDPETTPECWQLVLSMGLTPDSTKCQQSLSLLIVGLNPIVKPPKCFRRISADVAVRLTEYALADLPEPTPEVNGERPRFRPVDTSDAWTPPDDLYRSNRWRLAAIERALGKRE